MLKCSYKVISLTFRFPAATSKGDLRERTTWLVTLSDGDRVGIGECAPMAGFSLDWSPDFEAKLAEICSLINHSNISQLKESAIFERLELTASPSIKFGLETALRDLSKGGTRKIFDNDFYSGERPIPINGLVWMGSTEEMWREIVQKIENGFNCIKIKVGSRLLSFAEELELLKKVRAHWNEREVTLRVDANGAFNSGEVLDKLKMLAQFSIHSIEQPLAVHDPFLPELCRTSPIAVALDEELTGLVESPGFSNKLQFLRDVAPQAIVLKPSLHGGIEACRAWIRAADECRVQWWITSFLESSVGLNCLAQLAAEVSAPQVVHGLGTGSIYTNNIISPLKVSKGALIYDQNEAWNLDQVLGSTR